MSVTFPPVSIQEIEQYQLIKEDGSYEVTVTYVSKKFKSKFSFKKNGKPKKFIAVGLALVIGDYHVRYITNLFQKSPTRTIDRRFLWGYKLSADGTMIPVQGFSPVASIFLNYKEYKDNLPKPGDKVRINIGWRVSHTAPNEVNLDFPTDPTKVGMKLACINDSLRIVEAKEPTETLFFPELSTAQSQIAATQATTIDFPLVND